MSASSEEDVMTWQAVSAARPAALKVRVKAWNKFGQIKPPPNFELQKQVNNDDNNNINNNNNNMHVNNKFVIFLIVFYV